MPTIRFPHGRQFALTWGIPDSYGGMTRALLRRSRAFVQLAGTPVDVLTFERRDDQAEVERRLRDAGELIDGMRLLNLWDWFAQRGIPVAEHMTPIGTRTIDVGAHDGTPARSFRPWQFYRHWLDLLCEGDTSFLIVDSKTTAKLAATYRNAHAVVLHLVHNTHLGADGQLRESRREVFENLTAFDAVVILGQRQATEVVQRFGAADRIHVVPNSTALTAPADTPRGDRAVVVASLDARKRVDQAMRAADLAGVGLDVWGDGPLRERLEAAASPTTVFHGYGDVSAAYAGADLMLLTSEAEGFPLVLLETMAAGCPPIAYDVRYGPSDLIDDGVNGYLVPDGDVQAVAEAIRRFRALPDADRDRMRAAARATAERYSDEAVTRQWGRTLDAAARTHRAGRAPLPRIPIMRRVRRRLGGTR